MKKVFAILFFATFLIACQKEQAPKNNETQLNFLTAAEDAIRFEDLALYPIIADESYLTANEDISNFKPLREAIQEKRFRITEKKPFGRFQDRDAVNKLTIQNKSQDTVFIMSGDVIRGGKQDRVLAQNMIVLPRSIRNIDVFCVEHSRWAYQDQEESTEKEMDKEIFAFRGYYNIASKDIRETLYGSRSQQEVWDKVSAIRAKHGVTTQTEAYADLESSETFKGDKESYLQYFKNAFEKRNNVVGVVAISGNRIISTDIFGHSALFQKQYIPLLHSYITDALTNIGVGNIGEERLQFHAKRINEQLNGKLGSEGHLFTYDGRLVHFSSIK